MDHDKINTSGLDQEIETYLSDFTRSTVDDVINRISDEQDRLGQNYARSLNLMVLAAYVGTTLYDKLAEISAKSPNPDQVSREYQLYKLEIQNAISAGFEMAFTRYAGHSYDYVTQVKPIHEPQNKEVC